MSTERWIRKVKGPLALPEKDLIEDRFREFTDRFDVQRTFDAVLCNHCMNFQRFFDGSRYYHTHGEMQRFVEAYHCEFNFLTGYKDGQERIFMIAIPCSIVDKSYEKCLRENDLVAVVFDKSKCYSSWAEEREMLFMCRTNVYNAMNEEGLFDGWAVRVLKPEDNCSLSPIENSMPSD